MLLSGKVHEGHVSDGAGANGSGMGATVAEVRCERDTGDERLEANYERWVGSGGIEHVTCRRRSKCYNGRRSWSRCFSALVKRCLVYS